MIPPAPADLWDRVVHRLACMIMEREQKIVGNTPRPIPIVERSADETPTRVAS
jgi:hypothetical protein